MHLLIAWIFLTFFVFFSCLLIMKRFCKLHMPFKLFKEKKSYFQVDSSFQADLEEGFSSNTFDLYQNIENEDSRAGLDNLGKEEIYHIMNKYKCGFDDARVISNKERMKYNSIDPQTGKPTDPRAVFFS
ncbi:hypothetical protein PNEG_03481 [Pneumocystis murina B123]|uniref:Uncharacterized protein n=1 Tax=Pneumocystis murina (strain B123) TaxID=1069680 RepID=M7PC38_PNEMU|nr:hypothetical protein PNEG_03481 [Pneumocystis murina B123]EMR08039.1 hypothetical protein PNEG_03481 [Pneumocystis murina B123]